MKHVLRHPIGTGFRVPEPMADKLRLVHRGSDTEFEIPFSIDASGSGGTSWAVPKTAPLGEYELVFVTKGKNGRETPVWTDQAHPVHDNHTPHMEDKNTQPKTL